HPRLVLPEQIVVWILSRVIKAKVSRQVMLHETRTISVEGIDLMELAVGVMDCGIEGGGSNQGAELRDGIGQAQALGHLGGGFEIPRRKIKIDVEGMTEILVITRYTRDFRRQRLH